MVTRSLPRSRVGFVDTGRSTDVSLAFVRTSRGRVALTLHRALEEAEAVWKALQSTSPSTHAQSYDCARVWVETIARARGSEPVVVAGRSESGQTLFVWPLEIVRRHGFRTLQWIGQDLSNYNMGLFELHFARSLGGTDVDALLRAAADMAGGVALADFRKQPELWEGVPNPLRLLSHQASPNIGYSIRLTHDFDTLYRNRFSGRSRNGLRRKERKLADMGSLTFGWAATPEETEGLLQVFFAQKSGWFERQGIEDLFADPAHRAFYRALALLPDGTQGRLQIGYIKVGDTIAATFNGASIGTRFHLLLSSIEQGETERCSPGILLMREEIRESCLRGLAHFDFGAGQARHKSDWADEEVLLFDSFIPLNATGFALTVPLAIASRAKRVIKNNETLWHLAQSVRRMLPRRAAARDATAT